ncbi:hypothetical protein EDF38_0394 [Frigoribacterium sp. PhB160]|uniref:hypothetical protein n=1 Tax=Frigoribacterium sp. PhB160 TaxID=2485192 RepID=UPI000F49F389|nr:hypothetical protein [Frigoribacterium sp. PhB160]ROS61307.1 hypothetical protein EDF38_0394 [Frigoribacterium sp. PhB160]
MREDEHSTDLTDATSNTDDPTVDSPRSEGTIDEMQSSPVSDSPAVDDDIDEDAVTTLPGTGGPDDEGTVEVDPDEIDMTGHAGLNKP